jgi:hypothetical protein
MCIFVEHPYNMSPRDTFHISIYHKRRYKAYHISQAYTIMQTPQTYHQNNISNIRINLKHRQKTHTQPKNQLYNKTTITTKNSIKLTGKLSTATPQTTHKDQPNTSTHPHKFSLDFRFASSLSQSMQVDAYKSNAKWEKRSWDLKLAYPRGGLI